MLHEDCTAAELNSVTNATRYRRKILLAEFFFIIMPLTWIGMLGTRAAKVFRGIRCALGNYLLVSHARCADVGRNLLCL